MTSIYSVYSRLEAPVDEIKDAVRNDAVDLPDGIEGLHIARVNGKLQITAQPAEDVGKYTPAAMVKAGLSEEQVVIEDDGTVTHQSVGQYEQESGWKAMSDDDDELDTREIEYAHFYGREDEVLVHDHLRAEMFDVLCQLAAVCNSGHVQGIRATGDGELEPVWYDAGGERADAEISIEKTDSSDEEDDDAPSQTQWAR